MLFFRASLANFCFGWSGEGQSEILSKVLKFEAKTWQLSVRVAENAISILKQQDFPANVTDSDIVQ